jgi:hypothetical protein
MNQRRNKMSVIIYIITDIKENYQWNGEESIVTYSDFPSLAFEAKEDAIKWLKDNNKTHETIWEVNLYSHKEEVK